MNTRVFFTFCFVGSMLFTSCETHCPGFPEHLTDYFPYQMRDTLTFVNQHNDTLSFCIGSIYKSEEWSYGLFCKCDCGDAMYLFTASDKQLAFSLHGRISAGTAYYKPYLNFELGNNYWGLASLETSNLYFYDEFGKNSLFGETIVIEDKSQQISKVTIFKGKGITNFYDQKHNFQWISIK